MSDGEQPASMSSEEIDAMSRKVRAAYRARDPKAMADLYSPDAVVWHSNDAISMPIDRHIETFIHNSSGMAEFHYDDIRLDAIRGGYVQRHRSHGTMANGHAWEVHACVFYTVRGGRITRAEEYWDISPLRDAGAEPVH